MRTIYLTIALFVLLTLPKLSLTQIIGADSEGNTFFEIVEPSKLKLNFGFAEKKPLTISFTPRLGAQTNFYYLDNNQNYVYTVDKSNALLLEAGVTAQEETTNLLKINSKTIGYSFKIGFFRTLDSLHQISNVSSYFTYSYGLLFKYTSTPINILSSKATELTPEQTMIQERTIEGKLNLYHHSQKWAIMMNVAHINKSNSDSLKKSFITNPQSVGSNTYVFEKADGKYGSVIYNNYFTGAISVPVFIGNYFAYTPYYTRIFSSKTIEKAGLLLSYTGDRKIKFRIVNTVSLGIDWTRTTGEFNSAFVHIRGNFDIFDRETHKQKAQLKANTAAFY